MTDDDSAKLTALVEELRELGVGPGSDTRVVVFSERIPTLKWLAETVPAGWASAATRRRRRREQALAELRRGGPGHARRATSDDEQRRSSSGFGLRDDPVRLLFTGDVASEGVNLHQQCHLLIHYDLPWSLIRIEQRNGRIDRYGQARAPAVPGADPHQRLPWRRTDRNRSARRPAGRREAAGPRGGGPPDRGLARRRSPACTGRRRRRTASPGTSSRAGPSRSRSGITRRTAQGSSPGCSGRSARDAATARCRAPTCRRCSPAPADYFDEALRQVCQAEPGGRAVAAPRRRTARSPSSRPATCCTGSGRCRKSYLNEQKILPTPTGPGRLRRHLLQGARRQAAEGGP